MSASDITPFINTAGVVFLAVAIFFTQWRAGSKQVSAEVMDNYEKLVSQLRDELTTVKTEMVNMEKGLIAKIAKLEGALEEKERQLATMAEILANRNPELEKVLAEIRDFMRNLADANRHQTQILEAGQSRDKAIDTSTKARVGNVLRK